MKSRKHFFLNRQNIFYTLLAALALSIGVSLFPEEAGWGCFWLILGLIFCVGIWITPYFHVIDSKGIRIYYIFFLFKQEFLWENISGVEVCYGTSGPRSLPYLFDSFEIRGVSEGKEYFFMRSEISRTRQAKRLIERYMGERIDGFLIDDVKDMVREWRKRCQSAPNLEAAKQWERRARLAVKTALKTCPLGQDISLSYVFRQKEAESLKRPTKSYTYVLKVSQKTPHGNQLILQERVASIKVGHRKCRGRIYKQQIDSLPAGIQEAIRKNRV